MKTKFWRLSAIQLKGGQTYEGKGDSIFMVTDKKFILMRDKDNTVKVGDRIVILSPINTVTLTRKRNIT